MSLMNAEWSATHSAEHTTLVRTMCIGAALLGGLVIYVFVIGFYDTVRLAHVEPAGPGSPDRVLITDAKARYLLPASVRVGVLRPGCSYRLNYRPAEFGRSMSRAKQWRIVTSVTPAGCP